MTRFGTPDRRSSRHDYELAFLRAIALLIGIILLVLAGGWVGTKLAAPIAVPTVSPAEPCENYREDLALDCPKRNMVRPFGIEPQ